MPTVTLSEDTAERLDYLREEGETYDDVVTALLDVCEGEMATEIDSEDV